MFILGTSVTIMDVLATGMTYLLFDVIYHD